MSTVDTASIEPQMQRIEALVQQLEQCSDTATQNAAREMVQSLLELHAAGLAKMLELVPADERRELLAAWAADDLVGSLLLLHGLHPADLEQRVEQALDQVRPYLQSHSGNVELLDVAQGVVRLRMQGSCDGCPSSRVTVKQTIEQAIYEVAPDVAAIEVEGLEDVVAEQPAPAGLVQLDMPQ